MRTRALVTVAGVVSLLFAAATACSGKKEEPGGPTPTPAPTTFASTLSDCSATSDACAQADLGQTDHVISPLLFGDGMEWTQRGHDVLAPDPTGQTAGTFRPDVMAALDGMGFTMMRYPGGTLADLFHWSGAVGDIGSRTPQATLNVDSGTNMPTTEVPYFGPDEFADFASQLGTEILLTVNVGTGTAQEAADWVSHWEAAGVPLHYVEIGNEMYLPGPGSSFPTMDPATYAQKFDEYAAAIHAVDPALKLGLIGISDTTFWCTPNCTSNPWNQVVLSNVTEKADFFAIHNDYAPGTDQDGQSIYESMLSYPDWVRFDNDFVEQDIDAWAAAQNQGLPLATTEHASFFLPSPGADAATITAQVLRNQTWAAALFSALEYDGFIANPRMLIANHINPLHPLWQAPIAMAQPGAGYPDSYDPNPVVSAFGLVFKAYRELSGQSFVAATVTNSPTIDTQAISIVPAQTDVPLIDAVAVTGTAAGAAAKGWMMVVNRSLTTDIPFGFVLKGLPAGATTLEVEALSAPDYTAKNVSGAAPEVQWVTVGSAAIPAGASSFGTTLTLPRTTLLRIRVH